LKDEIVKKYHFKKLAKTKRIEIKKKIEIKFDRRKTH
jgi:hypothetical protein